MSTNKKWWFIVQVEESDLKSDFLVTANEEQSIEEVAGELERTILKRFKPFGPKEGCQHSTTFTIGKNRPDSSDLNITLSQLVTFLRQLPTPLTKTKPITPDLFGLGTNQIRVTIYDIKGY